MLDVGRGLTVPDVRPLYISGYNPDVNAALETCWTVGGLYAFPGAAGRMEVVSTSAQDGAGGTGILTVRIDYLDANYVEQSETVIMNGVGAVGTTAVNILRVNYFCAETAGTLGAVGTVTLRPFGGGATYARIEIGYYREYRAVYTVPASKRAVMLDWTVAASAAVAGHATEFRYRTNYDPYHLHRHTFMADLMRMSAQDATHRIQADDLGVLFGEKSDIAIAAMSDNVAAAVLASTFSTGILEIV